MVESTDKEAASTNTAAETESKPEMDPNPQTVELIEDKIVLNEDFKKNVAIPYFKDIYKDLAAQSDSKSKGINKVSILNVSKSLWPTALSTLNSMVISRPQILSKDLI